MKNLIPLALLVFVVAACNLSSKLKSNSNDGSSSSSSNSSSSGNPTKVGNDPVEKPAPTDAQIAALANGEEVKWDEQGMTWTLPPGWKKQSVSNNSFTYSFGTQVFLIVSISPMPPDFPTEASQNANHEGAKVRLKNGEVDEVKWLELDGVRGTQFRESKPQMGSDLRRLQWLTLRKYAGQVQNVNVMLSGEADTFAKHQDELYAILYSTKLVH